MQLLNKTTGIIEYSGTVAGFKGVEAYQHPEVEAKFELIFSQSEQRDAIRTRISQQAGDTASLLGTNIDATHALLYEVAKLSLALRQADSLEAVQAAAVPLAEQLEPFLNRIAAGEVRLPYQDKATPWLTELEQRASAIHTQLHP